MELSDGCFFALQLEPERIDAERMFTDLITAVRALAPAAIARAREAEAKEPSVSPDRVTAGT